MIEALWGLVQAHPYLALFPLIFLEGPMATLAAGSLIPPGAVTFPLAGALAVLAEMSADTALFTVGRLGRREGARCRLHHLGLTEARCAALERNLPGVLLGAKVADAAAIPVILAAGMSRIGYRRFLAWNLLLTVPKSLLLLGFGALFGTQLARFLSPTSGALLAAVVVGAYLLITTLRKTRLQGAQV